MFQRKRRETKKKKFRRENRRSCRGRGERQRRRNFGGKTEGVTVNKKLTEGKQKVF